MSNRSLSELWSKTLDILKSDLNIESLDTWFKATKPLYYNYKKLVILVPNIFAQSWLQDRYYTLVKNTLELLLNQTLEDVLFVLPEDQNKWLNRKDNARIKLDFTDQEVEQFEQKPTPAKNHNLLNSRYTFDSFVVGNSNRFTHAAALAVGETPAKTYNPLFIYGGVGLGKTHLMHAIGHLVYKRNPYANILYVSSETFVNELINSIKDDETEQFRNRYRNIDILLIDDIQFIARKERTQEEFFHTFNALYEANKQIVISSDRTPKEIPTLEDRLRSRFNCGLITDIQPPDFETRVAILRKKAAIDNLDVNDDIMNIIASKIQSNIRELEGALIKIAAYSSLQNKTIDHHFVEKALKDIISSPEPKEITIPIIQEYCAEYFNLKIEVLKSKRRTQAIAWPRQIAMYLCRELTDNSLPQIGKEFGGRDHTTVIHAYDKVLNTIKKDVSVANTIATLKEIIKN
ncbi:MAG: chromosomal replication initiator protein DnaA [Bacillota bacterium]